MRCHIKGKKSDIIVKRFVPKVSFSSTKIYEACLLLGQDDSYPFYFFVK